MKDLWCSSTVRLLSTDVNECVSPIHVKLLVIKTESNIDEAFVEAVYDDSDQLHHSVAELDTRMLETMANRNSVSCKIVQS